METQLLPLENFTKYYTQTKQRIDINIETSPPKVTAITKLTFIKKDSPPTQLQTSTSQIPPLSATPKTSSLLLKLNCENIMITQITLNKTTTLSYSNEMHCLQEPQKIPNPPDPQSHNPPLSCLSPLKEQ